MLQIQIISPAHKSYLLAIITLLVGLLMCSQSIAQQDSEQAELNQLLSLLSQQTSLATKTRLNADFVPGMMSIMSGEELEKKGFLTLWEAMGHMPGVLKSIDSTGMRTLTVRGISQTIGSGKIKLLLNDVVLNASSSSTTGTIFDTPISQIKRIEFIRSPGSAIHGEFSLAGVINVITKTQGKQLGAGFGSNQYKNFNTLIGFNNDGGDITGSFNIATFGSNGESLQSGQDKSPAGQSSYSPGAVNNKKDALSAIADLNIANLSLLFQYQQSNRGDHYGINNYLPPPEKQTVISDTSTTFQVKHKFNFSDQLNGNWSISQTNLLTDKNAQFLGTAPSFGGLQSDDDIISYVDIEESRKEAKLHLHYSLDSHHIYTEISYLGLAIEQYQQSINLDPVTLLPDTQLNQFQTPANHGQERHTTSLVLQDEISIDDTSTLTAGIRYDHYDDIGDNISPRIAFVWRPDDKNILKLQYAEAFRPPTLLELNGSLVGGINPEIIKTTEVSYILIEDTFALKNTLYSSSIKDLIAFENSAPFGYGNFENARLSGYELEASIQLQSNINISSNLTIQNSQKASAALKLYALAPWFISTSVDYMFSSTSSLNLLFKYIPQTDRSSSDSRGKASSTSQLDMTLHQNKFLGFKDVTLISSIKNILSSDIKYSSSQDTYSNDYLFSDNPSLWVELSFRPE